MRRGEVGGKAVASECIFLTTPFFIEPWGFSEQPDMYRAQFQPPSAGLGVLARRSHADSDDAQVIRMGSGRSRCRVSMSGG